MGDVLRQRSLPSVRETRHLDACFKFLGEAPGLDHDDTRGQLELIPDRRRQRLDQGRRVDAAPYFDRQHHRLQVALGYQFGLEVADVEVAENEVFEFRVIDIDAADFEKAAGAMGVFDKRKDREWPGVIVAALPGDQVARTPAQEWRDIISP